MTEAAVRIRAHALLGRVYADAGGDCTVPVNVRDVARAEGFGEGETRAVLGLLFAEGLLAHLDGDEVTLTARGMNLVRGILQRGRAD